MDRTFWIALGASSLAALVTALGIFTVRRFETWARAKIVYFISYAAGVLIAASFLHLVPESFAMNTHAAALLLAGFAGMHFLHRSLCAFVCERHHVIQPGIGVVPAISSGALGLHRHCEARLGSANTSGSSRDSIGALT